MISLKNIKQSFGAEKVFKDFNLQVKPGEFLALLGPSGAGKSTVLNLIAGLIKPQKGQITVLNKKLKNISDKKISQFRNQEIGYIFQEFYLFKHLNVLENVLLPSYLNNEPTPLTYAKKLLKEVGLQNHLHKKVTNLSGGQKQRVAIARALINKPQILLADEPTANLDKKTAQEIIKLLENLHKKHDTTLVIATHDPAIEKVANRIIKITNA